MQGLGRGVVKGRGRKTAAAAGAALSWLHPVAKETTTTTTTKTVAQMTSKRQTRGGERSLC